jgi:hypothetical protein
VLPRIKIRMLMHVYLAAPETLLTLRIQLYG